MKNAQKLIEKLINWGLMLVAFAAIPVLLHSCTASAAEGLVLRKAAIEGGSYLGTNHNAYLLLDNAKERLQGETSMLMDIDLACTSSGVCLFWNNSVVGKASDQQYRQVGWDFRLGLAVGQHIELGWHHLSEHELDRKTATGIRYPLENVAYIQLQFVNKPRR